MSEKQIEKAIIDYIFLIGGWATKVQSGAVIKKSKQGKPYKITLATAGTPDILACVNGKFVGIEVKKNQEEVEKWQRYPLGKRGKVLRPDGRTSSQKEQARQINNADGVFILCSSVDEVERDLKTLGII